MLAFSKEHLDAMYDYYDIQVLYDTDRGIAVAPSSSNTRFIKVRRDVTYKTIRFNVARFGEKPILPDSSPEEEDLILLGTKINFGVPVLNSTGYVYTAMGEYRYAYSSPKESPTNYRIASSPIDISSVQNHDIGSVHFAKSLK